MEYSMVLQKYLCVKEKSLGFLSVPWIFHSVMGHLVAIYIFAKQQKIFANLSPVWQQNPFIFKLVILVHSVKTPGSLVSSD
jgi:hypothetical protein